MSGVHALWRFADRLSPAVFFDAATVSETECPDCGGDNPSDEPPCRACGGTGVKDQVAFVVQPCWPLADAPKTRQTDIPSEGEDDDEDELSF